MNEIRFDGIRLNINHFTHEIEEAYKQFAPLRWNREGDVRIIPAAIIKEAVDVYEFWRGAPSRWSARVPGVVGYILWDQTTEAERLELLRPQSPSPRGPLPRPDTPQR